MTLGVTRQLGEQRRHQPRRQRALRGAAANWARVRGRPAAGQRRPAPYAEMAVVGVVTAGGALAHARGMVDARRRTPTMCRRKSVERHRVRFARHLLVGLTFLVLVAIGAIAFALYDPLSHGPRRSAPPS